MKFRKTVAVLLAAVLLAVCCTPAFAAETDKAALTRRFNNGVNEIKTELPYAVLTYTNGVPEGGIFKDRGLLDDGSIDEKAARYLTPLLEGLFNNNTNLSQSFIHALFNDAVSPDTTVFLKRGIRRDRRVPVYGESFVSALTPADDYEIEETGFGDSLAGTLTVRFADTTLEAAQNGSHAKVFSLPEGTIDPVIIGTRDTNGSTFLKDVRFIDFNVENASATARFNEYGRVVYYKTTVDYCFDFTFYDVMMLVSAFLGYNVYTAVIAAMNTVMANLDRDGISPEEILRDSRLHIIYRCAVELDKISLAERYYGDADGDGEVSVSDARTVLRHAVGFTELTNAVDLVMCDVDFDGEIGVEDAREILRLAVWLDIPFTEVPAGKKIRIADPAAYTAAQEQEGQTEPDPLPYTPGPMPGTEQDNVITEIIQGIFDIINATKEIRDAAKDPDEFV